MFWVALVVFGLSAGATATQAQEQQSASSGKSTEMAPLPIKLPKPMFVGTPKNIQSANLEKITGKPRPPFMAPKGAANLASGRPVSSSDPAPVIGELEQITDGDKEAADGSYVELGPGRQYIQVDLGKSSEIYAIVVWHFHSQARVYHDVVVQISSDPDFISDVKTVFNNDHDNSSGMGVGQDKEYVETNDGRLFDTKGATARYVRLYSNGNTSNDLNHYIEVEVYGKPVN
jgi:hypothetical protein